MPRELIGPLVVFLVGSSLFFIWWTCFRIKKKVTITLLRPDGKESTHHSLQEAYDAIEPDPESKPDSDSVLPGEYKQIGGE